MSGGEEPPMVHDLGAGSSVTMEHARIEVCGPSATIVPANPDRANAWRVELEHDLTDARLRFTIDGKSYDCTCRCLEQEAAP